LGKKIPAGVSADPKFRKNQKFDLLSCRLADRCSHGPDVVINIRDLEAGDTGGDPHKAEFIFYHSNSKLPPLAGRTRFLGPKPIG
jgi:hypothetical protein